MVMDPPNLGDTEHLTENDMIKDIQPTNDSFSIKLIDQDGQIKFEERQSDMKIPESGMVKGRVHFYLRDETDPNNIIVKADEWGDNLVVTTGKNHIADQMSDQGNAAMSHMAIGTGTTPAAAGDTALETELDRNALTSTTQGTGGDANKVIFVGDWAAGDGTGAITEAGIFNAASAGVLLCRRVFSVKNKGASDSLTITWELTFN